MSLAYGFSGDPSQVETPATPGGAQDPALSQGEAALPAAEASGAERRGPMRPTALSPLRSRMTGWMLGVIFRFADAAALSGIALAAAIIASPAHTAGAFAPFAVGAAAVLWGLSSIRAFDFAQGEGLARHLVRLSAGASLAALGLTLLLTGFRLAAVPALHFTQWFAASAVTLYASGAPWPTRRRAGRRAPPRWRRTTG